MMNLDEFSLGAYLKILGELLKLEDQYSTYRVSYYYFFCY